MIDNAIATCFCKVIHCSLVSMAWSWLCANSKRHCFNRKTHYLLETSSKCSSML